MPDVTIDGRTVSVPEGATVIQAAETLGIFIPRYCYHPALSIAGNCRICLVEVEKNAKLQIACNTPVSDGMVVSTNSAKAEDGRRSVLEFCSPTTRSTAPCATSRENATSRTFI